MLVNACEELSLRIAQPHFPHPKRRLWTWRHPNGAPAQLHHILINAKWFNSLRNCRAYSTVNVESDHRIVTAVIKLSLRINKNKSTTKFERYTWPLLQHDHQMQQKYAIEVENKFPALRTQSESDSSSSAQEDYDQLENIIKSVNNSMLKDHNKSSNKQNKP